MANPYLDELNPVVMEVKEAFEDGKLSRKEAYDIAGAVLGAVPGILAAASTFTDDDETNLLAAIGTIYREHIEPIDLPGPDFILDPILESGLLGISQGVINYYRRHKFAKAA